MATNVVMTDRVQCPRCRNVYVVSDLLCPHSSQRIPEPGKDASSLMTVHRHCPCDTVHALVYSPGDGTHVLVNGVARVP